MRDGRSRSWRRVIWSIWPAVLICMARAGAVAEEGAGGTTEADVRLERARALGAEAADRLGQELMGHLRAALEEGEAREALDVCQRLAPAVAESLSAALGVTVRRVSERPRNPAATPDAVERAVLARFATIRGPADTVFVSPVERAELEEPAARDTDDAGKTTYRYMRAIHTASSLCLRCHGYVARVDPLLYERILELYPEDRATGYRFRDLRGAFSVEIPLATIDGALPRPRRR